MGQLCSNFESDAIAESPAAYVVAMRKRHLDQMIEMQKGTQKVSLDDMTAEELREYYDNKANMRLGQMSDADQAAMFKKFTVSSNTWA